MSATAAAAAPAAAAPKSGGKKKLLLLLAIALLVLALGGGGLVFFLKKRQAAALAAEGEDAGTDAATAAATGAPPSPEHRTPPTFVPLDPFVVNLADRDADRYAQIGVVLQVTDSKVGEEISAYKPAIRNNILLLLAHKSSADLAGSDGKVLLASELRREALRAMGYQVAAEPPAPASGAAAAKALRKRHEAEAALPITAVQFSSFIIQ